MNLKLSLRRIKYLSLHTHVSALGRFSAEFFRATLKTVSEVLTLDIGYLYRVPMFPCNPLQTEEVCCPPPPPHPTPGQFFWHRPTTILMITAKYHPHLPRASFVPDENCYTSTFLPYIVQIGNMVLVLGKRPCNKFPCL